MGHHHLPDFLEEGDITHHHIIVILGRAIIIAVGNVGMAGVEVETVVHGEKDVKADDGLVNNNNNNNAANMPQQNNVDESPVATFGKMMSNVLNATGGQAMKWVGEMCENPSDKKFSTDLQKAINQSLK